MKADQSVDLFDQGSFKMFLFSLQIYYLEGVAR